MRNWLDISDEGVEVDKREALEWWEHIYLDLNMPIPDEAMKGIIDELRTMWDKYEE